MQTKLWLTIMLIFLALMMCACTNTYIPKDTNNNGDNTIAGQDRSPPTFKYIADPKKSSHNTYNIYMSGEWSETQINGAIVYLPKGSEVLDLYSEKIAIAVTFLDDSKRDLASLMAENEAEMRSIVKSLNIYSKEDFKLGPLDGILTKGDYSIMNNTIEFTKISALQDNRFYRFEITCTQNPCKHLDIFYEMAKSFEPKNFEPEK